MPFVHRPCEGWNDSHPRSRAGHDASLILLSCRERRHLRSDPCATLAQTRNGHATPIEAADARCARRSKAILGDVKARGDAAIRDLSKKFDNWEPASFRLTPQEIEKRDRAGVKARPGRHPFAQAQVRNFAQKQRDTMQDLEVETLPGVILGHKPYPGERDRLLRAGRPLPDGGLGAYVDRHRQAWPGVKRIIACAPPYQGRAASGDRRSDAFRRRRRNLCAGRRAGGGGDGARHRDHRSGRHDRRPRQCLCRRSQAPVVRPRRHRPVCRPDRDADHRRRHGGRRDLRDRPARPGRARPQLAGGADHQFGKARQARPWPKSSGC